MRERVLFVAGSTGATGKVLVSLAPTAGVAIVPHERPSRARPPSPGAKVFDLGDGRTLDEVLRGCTSVAQLIGSTRSRFVQGDTYEASDIGTTRSLVEGAKVAGVDHFLLLSSVGAGHPVGAYLKAKASAERLVRESGLAYTIFRPSALEGGERGPIPGLRAFTKALGLRTLAPIRLEELANAMLYVARTRSHLGDVLEGASLWKVVAQSSAAAA